MNENQQADDLAGRLDAEQDAMLDELADAIVKRRLTPAALFFFESMKPLNFVTSQMMHFFRPLVQVIWSDPQKYDRAAKLLEDRGAIEVLCRRLEARS